MTTLKKIAIIALLLLGACSSQEYIFDSIDVKVVKAKKITGKHAGSWYTEYELETDSPSPNHWIKVSNLIDEKDIARTIGENVHIGCRRREPKDYCHAVGYQFKGRGVKWVS